MKDCQFQPNYKTGYYTTLTAVDLGILLYYLKRYFCQHWNIWKAGEPSIIFSLTTSVSNREQPVASGDIKSLWKPLLWSRTSRHFPIVSQNAVCFRSSASRNPSSPSVNVTWRENMCIIAASVGITWKSGCCQCLIQVFNSQ